MVARAGLRTEIVVNITLLMSAALLFTGFLLLKLTERELVAQRVGGVAGTMKIVARAAPLGLEGDRPSAVSLPACVAPLLGNLSAAVPLEGWALFDRQLRPLPIPGGESDFSPDAAGLNALRGATEPVVRVHYPSVWLPFGAPPESFVVVTAPVQVRGEFAGAVQARFSLADVRRRVTASRRVFVLYALLYGAVLILSGIYFMSRTVVRPIRDLQHGTRRVAAGDLQQALPIEGPREIAELAGSFNTMVEALRASRLESEGHILCLRQANEELRRTRDELVRSEKMASVGHLAAGMAHEIGNPLGAVVGYLELLRSELAPGRPREIAERSLAEAGRIDRLVRDLLDYAAPARDEAQTFDPGAALSEARDLLLHQGALDEMRLDDRRPPALPAVRIPRHRLVQVFVNLLLNARDASPRGGSIRLEGGEEGEHLWLSVTDWGVGMSPELLSHIFDPFYTTKPPGKGRGLGLAVCQRVVAEAGGRIEVRSAPGEGSVFTVWLRRAKGSADDA